MYREKPTLPILCEQKTRMAQMQWLKYVADCNSLKKLIVHFLRLNGILSQYRNVIWRGNSSDAKLHIFFLI